MKGGRTFALMHAANAVLSLAFTLAQTLVLARSLETTGLAQAIAVMAISLYLLPLNQAVARANFILLRQGHVGGFQDAGAPEAAAAYRISQALLLAASLCAPLLVAPGLDPRAWVALAAFGYFCTFSNLWFFEIQSAMLATERAITFEILSFVRRLTNVAALLFLYVQKDFLTFAIVLAAETLLFQVIAERLVRSHSRMFSSWSLTSRAAALTHARQVGVSFQATAAEWFSLNAVYAVFTVRYGVGPSLVVLDAGMKLLRVMLTGVRNLSEIVLPQASRAVLEGKIGRARSLVAVVLGLGALAAIPAAAVVALKGDWVLQLILGPTHPVPDGVGPPLAIAILATVGFQAGSLIVGHIGRNRDISLFAGVAVVASIASGTWILLGSGSVVSGLYAFAAALSVASVAGLLVLARTFRAPAPAALSVPLA
ncbi:hypothetical protein BZG35_05665 [Brevundimonas sp. LM2]|uniref:hypothetical protein n=1 Tax=Brevundimonas sp. LM2 TaxID=1938605 RepID=UPI000983F745|nr:hypothetical protein [Brevundimonas sp. LM2]AQR61195.1 hypothetical protein BZG35_05665 [Brevundimonas sp. LM2]